MALFSKPTVDSITGDLTVIVDKLNSLVGENTSRAQVNSELISTLQQENAAIEADSAKANRIAQRVIALLA